MSLNILRTATNPLIAAFVAAMVAAPPVAHAQPKVSITGQIRFNAIYTNVAESRGQTPILPSNVPFTSGPGQEPARAAADQLKFDARRTRLNLSVADKVQGTDARALVQIDFDTTEGNSTGTNARGPRLRLAYAEAKPGGLVLRVGQQRTLVSDVSDGIMGGAGYPLIVNEAAWGILNARQPGIQVAWFTALGGGRLGVGAGVEQQSFSVATTNAPPGALGQGTGRSAVAFNQAEGQNVPVFATGVHYRDKLFGAFLRGAASRARFTSANGAQDAANVWLGALSGDVTPFAPLTLYAQYWRSEGLNRLNIIGFPDVTVVDVDPGAGVRPETRPIRAKSWRVGTQYRPSRELRLNAVYEAVDMNATESTFAITDAATQLDRARSLNVNFIYAFWTNWETGLEFMRGRVGTLGSTEGEFKGVLARLWYYF